MRIEVKESLLQMHFQIFCFQKKHNLSKGTWILIISRCYDISVQSRVRGLLFKFVDFLQSISEVFDRVIKDISSEKIFFSLSFDV